MKKLFLILPVLAVFAMTGCKRNNGESSNGGSSGGEEQEKINEVKQAIEATHDYKGSLTVAYQTVMGADIENEKITFNAETKEYAKDNGDSLKVLIPQEDNLSKYYYVDNDTPSDSYFEIASQSYADYLANGALNDEAVYMATTTVLAASELQMQGKADLFKNILMYELNDGMLSSMGVYAEPEQSTTEFRTGVNEQGVKTATYALNAHATPLIDAEYPQADVVYEFTIEYGDKINRVIQNMSMNYKVNASIPAQTMSMFMSTDISYEFDTAFYNACKDETVAVVADHGNKNNYFYAYVNGVEVVDGYSLLVPNQDLTVENIKTAIQSRWGSLSNVEVTGVYTDAACTTAFTNHKSTEYEECVYLTATPKTGYSLVYLTERITRLVGDLPFTQEEYDFYMAMMRGGQSDYVKLHVVANTSDYIIEVQNSNSYVLKNMTLDGEKYTSNKIPQAEFAAKAEHKFVLNYEYTTGEYGDVDEPALLASRLISNNENGIMVFGPNNSSTFGIKLNTSDFQKANPTFTVKAYQSDVLLEAGDSLPEGATLLTSAQADISCVVDGSSMTALPEDYSGEFIVKVELDQYRTFVYLVIE